MDPNYINDGNQSEMANMATVRGRAFEQRQALDAQKNKQKYIPKNLSFAIIQSENAMSVGNLSHANHII